LRIEDGTDDYSVLAALMRNEFTAIVEQDEEWFIASCPEIPGANGQGRTREECLANLAEAIELIMDG
jgi:predicted RNase H-like HicB family nuclease